MQLEIDGPSGALLSQAYLSLADLNADPNALPGTQLATVRSARGELPPAPNRGTTAAGLVMLAHISPQAVTNMTIVRATAGRPDVQLTAPEITQGFLNDPLGAPRYATFDPTYDPEVHFFRPVRDGSDTNFDDGIDPSTRADLKVKVTTNGRQLGGAILAASPTTTPAPGVAVHFTLTPPSDLPPDVTFFWDFGDSTTAQGPGPQDHAYDASRYTVQVTFVAPDGSSGISNPVVLNVGQTTDGGTATTPAPPAGPTTSGSGGNGSGGGHATAGGGNGGHNTTASGARKGASSGTIAPKDSASRSQGTTKTTTKSHAAASSTAPAATAAPATGTPATTAGGSAAASSKGTPTGTTPAARAPTDRARPSDRRPSSGPRVAGVVVAGTGSDVSAAIAAADALARQPDPADPVAARAAAGHGWRPLGWIAGGAVFVGLLALGAVREGLRPRRLRGSRRLRLV
ncbi:MAG TPA: PKD domain-containing protein [Baekduia sp.]